MAATRWGIVSAGKISFDFTNALSMLPDTDHKVLAVAARALPSAEKFATQFNIPKSYGSYKELAADPDIDIVYVGAIHPAHFDVSKLMIEAGKNVLCEKPMTMNAKEAKIILALAKQKNVFFLEGFWSRFFPVYDKLREELKKKTIGDVKFVKAGFGVNGLERVARLKQKDLGGGATLDLGVYTVQFAQLVFGEYPEKIIASGILTDTEVDEATFMTLYFSGNRVAQLHCHAGADITNDAEIVGTKGKIQIPYLWCPDRLTVAGETYVFPLPTASTPMNFFRSEGFIYEAEAVRQCLLKGEKEAANFPHEHSLWNMSIVTEVLNQIGVKYD